MFEVLLETVTEASACLVYIADAGIRYRENEARTRVHYTTRSEEQERRWLVTVRTLYLYARTA